MRFGEIFRHPIFVAFFSVVLGTWLFGQYSYWRERCDSRREKSVALIEETSKNFNSVLTDIFLCIQKKKPPADDALSKSRNDLFKQRFVVAIKSEAFLESSKFSDQYDSIVRELNQITDSLYQPNPPYDQLQAKADAAWRHARDLLSKALSDAMRQQQ